VRGSTRHILTTHTGSLPRPKALAEIERARDQREARGHPEYAALVRAAVAETVAKQRAAGLDVINDGEVSKVSYSTYMTDRLTGFDGEARPRAPQVEAAMFPEFYGSFPPTAARFKAAACTGPIQWRGDQQVQFDIDNLKAATAGAGAEEVFMSAASPGVIAAFLDNQYYPTAEAYIFALAEAMQHEYQAIAAAGFVLQLDCPDLAMTWNRAEYKDKTMDDFCKAAEMHVEALNSALQGIPREQVRVHLCWGNTVTPHVRDIPLQRVIGIAFKAHATAVSFEGANPRHEHEWKLFENVKLPEGMTLIPGVIDSTTNFVEHPELVAERIVRYANVVGRERVMASTDCGFGTAAGTSAVHPEIAWAKLQAMAEGAKLASQQLWK
jgi:5-methyltetrahydropteroyltriglutamate--homocysteine methyltransferase